PPSPASATATTPATALTALPAPVGTTVTVTGTNFTPSHSIPIQSAGSTVTTTPGSCQSSASGSFSCSFTVPSVAAGDHTVTASDGTNSPSATFTVTSAPTKLGIGTSAQTITAGTTSGVITVQLQAADGTPVTDVSARTI